jgi:RNA polymerase sigma-70 factor, ECF subfamily
VTPSPDDAGAFERAVLPHLDDAYAIARYLLRDEHDAQDAVHDAFLRALRFYDPFTVADARAWLLTIVRRCCFDWRSRRQSERSTMHGELELRSVADPSPGPDAAASASALRAVVTRALDSLPDDQREILVLREMQQLSYREIAQVVGLPIGTVMSRLSRARRRLQQTLGPVQESAG